MILFAPGPPTPPLHRRHRIVKELDRWIRHEQATSGFFDESWRTSAKLQVIRKALVGKKLRPNNRTGARARQRRLRL